MRVTVIRDDYRDAVASWLRGLGPLERKALAVGIATGQGEPAKVVALLADPRLSVELRFDGELPRGAELTD